MNIKIDKDFRKYALGQIIFMFVCTLFFFVLFYYNFGIVLASFILWVMIFTYVLIIYLDLKFMYLMQKQNEEIDNIKFILKNKRW